VLRLNNILLALLCAALAALALAGPAAADGGAGSISVTEDQYEDTVSQFAGGGGGTADPTGSLPFTGLDVALMGVAAAALLGAGFVLHRRQASDDTA
jgi:hypothetical protein